MSQAKYLILNKILSYFPSSFRFKNSYLFINSKKNTKSEKNEILLLTVNEYFYKLSINKNFKFKI